MLPSFYDVYGATSPSAVANSQWHYGSATPVFIEDQPLSRGNVVASAALQTALYQDIKLLVPNFSNNDFGDTHSLVLIVDSLAVQDLLARLSPSIGTGTLMTILQSASHEAAAAVPLTQGHAEGDVLENVVNALSRIFMGPGATQLQARLEGGTWADPNDRNTFYNQIKALRESPAFSGAVGRYTLTATAGDSGLASRARTDFSAFLSLVNLSPFALRAASDADAVVLEASLAANWGDLRTEWITDKNATTSGQAAQNFSDTYLNDRVALLQGQMFNNLRNVDGVIDPLTANTVLYTDVTSETRLRVGALSSDAQRRQIWFGGNDAESFSGNGQADHLYGGAGADTLRGLGGTDWLEGQSGADSLEGGAGNDTLLGGSGDDRLDGGDADDLLRGGTGSDVYRFSGTFGTDVIEDSDGQGSIEVGSLGALGANTVRVSDTAWQSADGRVRYVRMPAAQAGRYDLVITVDAGADVGTITVRNWNPGDLGLSVPSNAAPGSFVHTVYGDIVKRIHTDTNIRRYEFADGNYAADGAAPGAADVLLGQYGNVADALYGLGGNDGLYGDGGDDLLDGGEGNDLLLGGEGQDTIVGGGGDDFIWGSGQGWFEQPINPDFAPIGPASLEYARGFSWLVYGWLQGDRAASASIGGGVYELQPSDYVSRDTGNVIDAGAGRDVVYAGTGDDFVSAGEDDDVVIGMHGADMISGDAGADRLYGDGPSERSWNDYTAFEDHGDDWIAGGSGNDTIYGQGGSDELFGGLDDDLLYGDAPVGGRQLVDEVPGEFHGNDYLDGGDGNDYLFGGGRNDELVGGDGDDSLWGDDDRSGRIDLAAHGRDSLDGGLGRDYLEGGGDADLLSGGDGNDTLYGDGNFDIGYHGADWLDGGTGDDYLEGGRGADTLLGGDGDDNLYGDYTQAGGDTAAGEADVLDGGEGDDSLRGQGGDDVLLGGGGQDVLFGGTGNDTLDGGAGTDYMDGGAGDDLYMLRMSDMGQVNGYNEFIEDSSGSNTLVFADAAAASLGSVQVDSAGTVFLDFGQDRGVGLNSSMLGNSSFRFTDQTFTGAQLVSRFGNDLVVSFSTPDGPVALAGSGDQTILAATDRTTISAGTGNDTIRASGGGNRYLYERGDGIDTIYDGSVKNGVLGRSGASRIVFGQGITLADLTFVPGTSRLEIRVGTSGTDAIRIEGVGGGNAAVVLPIDRLEFADGSSLDLAERYRQGFTVTGSTGADVLWGSASSDRLDGLSGDDTLYGAAGDDALYGGAGNDSLEGGAGADLLDGGDGLDVLTGSDGADTLLGGAGDDIIVAWASNVADGGTGNDLLGGSGTYLFGRGDGQDRYVGSGGTIQLRAGITPANVVLRQVLNTSTARPTTLELGLVGSADTLTVPGFLDLDGPVPLTGAIAAIRFDDGTVWNTAAVRDRLFSGTLGNDTITGTMSADLLRGGDGNDFLDGWLGGNDSLEGGAGNDLLMGRDGNDVLRGGTGDDRLIAGVGDDVVVYDLGDGNDFIDASEYDDRADRRDVLRFGAGIAPADLMLRQVLTGVGSTSGLPLQYQFVVGIRNQLGTVTIDGLMSYADDAARTPIRSFEFADGTVWDTAAIRSHLLGGTAGDDFLSGTPESDTISGGAGNDTLNGYGLNPDTLLGGDGDDTYFVWYGDGADRIEDTGGNDRVVFQTVAGSGVLPSDIKVTTDGNDLLLTIGGYTSQPLRLVGAAIEGGSQTIESLQFTDGTVWTATDLLRGPAIRGTSGNDALDGTARADRIFGGAGNDTLRGMGGDDAIEGEAGNDSLVGGEGADTMRGGVGNDTYVVDAAGDVVTEAANEGTDTVQSSITWALGGNLENLVLADVAAIDGTGNTLNNALTGNSAANRLDGGAGVDTMTGGAGNDTYVVDNASDRTIEAAGGGTDTVEASLSWTLAAEVENLTLTGVASINATGNALANALRGNAADNVLNGSSGNDTMLGGTGNDTYVVDATGDVVTENANEGIDTVQSSVTWTLSANVENLTLTGTAAINATGNTLDNVLVGNAGNNTLTGGAGNDSLDGGAGTDTLIGGAGNDSYTVDAATDVITENASEGTDTVNSSIAWTLGNNLENLTLTGTGAINATGNTLANTLRGNAANNLLSGGTGNDTMLGGAGNDTYVVDATGDVVTENASEGTDTVQSAVTWTLGSNLENLTLTGTAAINGTGNALDNLLTGNSANNTLTGGAGNDVLDGGAGNDTMLGGAGNDSYFVNVTTDVVTENANEGADTVNSAVTWTLGNNLENLTLTGTSAINGTGNTLANTLIGNSANNTLTGGAGNDVLDGGTGNDTMLGGAGDDGYFVNVTTDVVTENANEGTDTINSAVTWALGNNVENLTLTGTTAINGTGNALANTLIGNSAVNTLTGGEGADIYWGAAGNDALTDTSTTSADVYRFGRGDAQDTLRDSGGSDRLEFLSGITSDQIWLRRVGSDLELSIIGTNDRMTVGNWYGSTANRVETLRTADGLNLTESRVQALVDAMASFSPPAIGETTLPPSYSTALSGTIAANWQP